MKITKATEQWLIDNKEKFELVGSSCIDFLTPNDEDRVVQAAKIPKVMMQDIWDCTIKGKTDTYDAVVIKVERDGQKYDFLICVDEEEYFNILAARDSLKAYLSPKDAKVKGLRVLKVSQKPFRAGWYEAHRNSI